MALQSSGQITLEDIQGEFGGTAPHSLKEYYGATSTIPSSGEISIKDFYGKSAFTGPVVELFTTSINNFTPAVDGWDSATVYVIGGGGGGGGSNDNDASAASGGTAGGTAIRHYTDLTGASIVVGAGGGVQAPSGGYNGDSKYGYNGGSSTFTPFSGSTAKDGGSSNTTTLSGGGGYGGSAEHGSRKGATAPSRPGGSASGGSTNYSGQATGGIPGPNSTTVAGSGTSVSLTGQLTSYSYPNQGENTFAAAHLPPVPSKPADFTNTAQTYYLNGSLSSAGVVNSYINLSNGFQGGRGMGSQQYQLASTGFPRGAGGGAVSWTGPTGYQSSYRPGYGSAGCVVIVYKGGAPTTPASVNTYTFTADRLEAELYYIATANGWNGNDALTVNINSGVYLWSDTVGAAALTIAGSYPNGLTINNYGYIMGRGGDGGLGEQVGGNGSPAVSNSSSNVTIINHNGAYIAGGGGGGGGGNGGEPQSRGGGGAGGGLGGSGASPLPGQASSSYTLDGGQQPDTTIPGAQAGGIGGPHKYDEGSYPSQTGGRVLPGTASSGGNHVFETGSGNQKGYQWVGGGGAGQAGTNATVTGQGGGGGGWGAAGGTGKNSRAGGAAGAAISGTSVSLTNNGTIYGAT